MQYSINGKDHAMRLIYRTPILLNRNPIPPELPSLQALAAMTLLSFLTLIMKGSYNTDLPVSLSV